MKAYVRTDAEYVILAFAESASKAKLLLVNFDGDDTHYTDIRVERVPALDGLYDEPTLVDEETGKTWCDECDQDFPSHEYWHYRGHRGGHCFEECML